MEVKETAACGISEREFAIDLSETEITKFYKMLKNAVAGADFDKEMAEELLENMRHVVGAAIDM